MMVGSNDLTKSKVFYDAVFGALGAEPGASPMEDRLFYSHNDGIFVVITPINGEPACHANGGTIGFAMTSPEQVEAWHAAGVAAGGKSCEDPPGVRNSPFGDMYLAYLRDPDGNKLCALHRLG
jgi:catechol 2,3-dioxygenase-like lactoylglutathione lyase family enzyme